MRNIILFFLLAIVFSGCSLGRKELVIKNAWSRPTAADSNGVVYLEINNSTNKEMILTGVLVSIEAVSADVHESSIDEQDIMRMELQDEVKIPAKSIILFEPGGLHIMIVGLVQELKNGEQFEVTLMFSDGTQLLAPVSVTDR